MNKQQSIKGSLVSVAGKIALLMLGVGAALGMMELLLRTFPNWVPSEVRVNPPARRVKALLDETYDLKQSNGDLYHLMRGKVVPLSPDQDQMVAHVHMITDAHGFRNSPPERVTYSIVALGDSFTRASGVPTPWPQKLAEYAGTDVLNLGDVAFGPQDELKALKQYGLKKQPQLVILAYFEGNDLHDAASYDQATPLVLARFSRYLVSEGIDTWQRRRSGQLDTAVVSSYTYPISVTINNADLELTFFSYYISWLSVNSETIESSQNYRLVTETILEMQELSEAADARFLLVYVPSKEHVYLPYLDNVEILARVFSDVPTIELDEAGFLEFTSDRATSELTQQHLDDQADLMAEFLAVHKILFLDLTPTFQDEAGKGAELYYPFDTHWNQLGHDVAAQAIARYIEEMHTASAGTDLGQ